MAGDRNDFRQRAPALGKQGDGGSPKIVEVQAVNPGQLACLLPLLGKISLLKSEAGLGGQD